MFKMFRWLFPFTKFSFADDETGEGGGGEGDGKKSPPPGANQELDTAQAKIKELEEKAATLEKEKSGIYRDLKQEQEKRRQTDERLSEIEAKIKGEEEKNLSEQVSDDEYITGKHFKTLLKDLNSKERQRLVRDLQLRSAERVFSDEQRLMELIELNPRKYPVPYQEAVDAFKELADKDSSLWDQFDSIKLKPGGRPAEFVYKYALDHHDKFQKSKEKTIRESLLDDMRREESKPVKIKTGAGAVSKKLDDLTDEDISNLSDEELDRISRGK
jgi:hypothetical protein